MVDSSKYYTDAFVDKLSEQAWPFTGFYGEPVTWRRHEAWSKLRALNIHPTIPWLYAGDFNKITRHEGILVGALQSHNQMQSFRDIIDEGSFMDLGFIGPKFTWCNNFDNGHSIWERLDQ